MRFKYWLHLQETIDQNTEDKLLQQKVDPNQLNDFINQLKTQPEFIDTKSAFVKLQDKFPFLRKDKNFPEPPTDPFFKEYYVQLTEGQITKPEYYTLLFFKDKSQGSLTRMMLSLRNLIQEGKIELNFINNIPTIVYQKKAIPNEDFTKFNANLDGIEGQDATKPSNNNLADPFFLEVSHKEKLVAKSADGTIWVFKATGPLDCRLMGKGHSWCISSSSSAEWYFNYRHDHGQTQYFIFDFNKGENDSARYVNPGIAPESGYSEWVDTRNNPNNINGYSSVQEYKNYLKDKGIDIGVFVADPLTEEEKLLKRSSEKYGNSFSSGKDDIFQQFKEGQYKELFDKFIETMSFLDIGLMEDHFNQLSDQQKKFYLLNTKEGLKFLFSTFKNRDEMANQILALVKDELDSDIISALLKTSYNRDELINQIFPLVKDKLVGDMVKYLLDYSSNRDERINQILPLVKNKLDGDMVGRLLDYSSNKDELINQIFPLVKDKLNGDLVKYLLYYSSKQNRDEMTNQIFPLVKDKLDSDIISALLKTSYNRDELINQILPLVKDKLDSNMVDALLDNSSKPDELINQILPLVKDKLDVEMVEVLLYNSKNKDEMANQIFPLVKDKLDSVMVARLLDYSKNRDEMTNQILPLVKDKLDSSMVRQLLRYSSKTDERINQILSLVKNKLDSNMVDALLDNSSKPDELINQILPLVKDKLDSSMVKILLRYSSNRDEIINQILPLVKDKLDLGMVARLLDYSKNRDEMTNQILPLVKDKLDSSMVKILLHYSSNRDELKKRIDAMKFRVKE